MSDEILNIRMTESEINLITMLLEQAGTLQDENGQPAFELLHDIMEQVARCDDGWDTNPSDLVICDAEINAETQMFNAGVDAREKMKATSRAASRRALNLASPDADDRSEVQAVDVWDKPSNDPADW